jgi:photosystem II stability/assembly factor-like uncharacterized protein
MKKITFLFVIFIILLTTMPISAQWKPSVTGIGGIKISRIYCVDNYIFLNDMFSHGYFVSVDSGKTWQKSKQLEKFTIYYFIKYENKLFAITNDTSKQIKYSTDNGQTWTDVITESFFIPYDSIFYSKCIYIKNHLVVLTTTKDSIFSIRTTTDFGKTWVKNVEQHWDTYVLSPLILENDSIYFYLGYNYPWERYSSTDYGMTWQHSEKYFPSYNILKINDSTYYGLSGNISTDGALSWNHFFQYDIQYLSKEIIIGVLWKPISERSHIYISNDLGKTWIKTIYIAERNGFINIYKGRILDIDDTRGGVNISSDTGKTWQKSVTGLTEYTIDNLFNAGDFLLANNKDGNLYISRDNGETWENHDKYFPNRNCIYGFYKKDSIIYAAVFRNVGHTQLYISSDNARTWLPLTRETVNDVCGFDQTIIFDNKIFSACGHYLNIFNKHLQKWFRIGMDSTKKNNALKSSFFTSLFVNNQYLLAGTTSEGLFISKDTGFTLTNITNGFTQKSVKKILGIGNDIYLCSNGGLFVSRDNGLNWTEIAAFHGEKILDIVDAGLQRIIVADSINGIYISSDGGESWKQSNNGLSVTNVNHLLVSGSKILASVINNGLFICDLQDLFPTVVKSEPGQQCDIGIIPNPVTGQAEIKINILLPDKIKLSIVNSIGETVEIICDGRKMYPAGTISFDLTSENLSAGIYFCVLESGNKRQSFKFVIVK